MNSLFYHRHGGAGINSGTEALDFSVNISPISPPIGTLTLNGAIEGIYLLPRALGLRHILVLSPSFYEYERAARISGAEVTFLPLTVDNGFQLPGIEQLAEALLDADAFFVRNFPSLEENYFRFAIRRPVENDRLLDALRSATLSSGVQ